jgi:hypothetical protein
MEFSSVFVRMKQVKPYRKLIQISMHGAYQVDLKLHFYVEKNEKLLANYDEKLPGLSKEVSNLSFSCKFYSPINRAFTSYSHILVF